MWPSRCRRGRLGGSHGRDAPATTAFSLLLSAFCFLGWGSALSAQARQAQKAEAEPATKPQPIPFSHKLHAQFVVDCLYCHAIEASGREMTYPAEALCMQCHATIKAESPEIKRLAGFDKQKKPVPWVRIYEIPDYVFFSHRVHFKRAKIDCQVCHGPVAEREVVTNEKPTSMQACMTCHKQEHAPNNCHACHER